MDHREALLRAAREKRDRARDLEEEAGRLERQAEGDPAATPPISRGMPIQQQQVQQQQQDESEPKPDEPSDSGHKQPK